MRTADAATPPNIVHINDRDDVGHDVDQANTQETNDPKSGESPTDDANDGQDDKYGTDRQHHNGDTDTDDDQGSCWDECSSFKLRAGARGKMINKFKYLKNKKMKKGKNDFCSPQNLGTRIYTTIIK